MTGTGWGPGLDRALSAAFKNGSQSPLKFWKDPVQEGFRRTCHLAAEFVTSARRTGHSAQVFETEGPKGAGRAMRWHAVYKVRFRGRTSQGPCQRTVVVCRLPSRHLLMSFHPGPDLHWGTASDLAEVLEGALADEAAPFLAEVQAGYEAALRDDVLQARLREQDLRMQAVRKGKQAEKLAHAFGDLMAQGWSREDVLTVWKETEVREVMDR